MCLTPQMLSQLVRSFLLLSGSLLDGGWGEDCWAFGVVGSWRDVRGCWWGLEGRSDRWPVARGATFDVGGALLCLGGGRGRSHLLALETVVMGIVQSVSCVCFCLFVFHENAGPPV